MCGGSRPLAAVGGEVEEHLYSSAYIRVKRCVCGCGGGGGRGGSRLLAAVGGEVDAELADGGQDRPRRQLVPPALGRLHHLPGGTTPWLHIINGNLWASYARAAGPWASAPPARWERGKGLFGRNLWASGVPPARSGSAPPAHRGRKKMPSSQVASRIINCARRFVSSKRGLLVPPELIKMKNLF